jgi:hypothetical protein
MYVLASDERARTRRVSNELWIMYDCATGRELLRYRIRERFYCVGNVESGRCKDAYEMLEVARRQLVRRRESIAS